MSLHVTNIAHVVRDPLYLQGVGHLYWSVLEVQAPGELSHDVDCNWEQEEAEEGVKVEERVVGLPVEDGGAGEPVVHRVGVLGPRHVHREQEARRYHGQGYQLKKTFLEPNKNSNKIVQFKMMVVVW